MPRKEAPSTHRTRASQQGPDLNKNTPEQQEPICAQHTRHTTDLVRTQNTPRNRSPAARRICRGPNRTQDTRHGHWARPHTKNANATGPNIHRTRQRHFSQAPQNTYPIAIPGTAHAIGPGRTQKTPHSQGSDTHRRGLTSPRHTTGPSSTQNRPRH